MTTVAEDVYGSEGPQGVIAKAAADGSVSTIGVGDVVMALTTSATDVYGATPTTLFRTGR